MIDLLAASGAAVPLRRLRPGPVAPAPATRRPAARALGARRPAR